MASSARLAAKEHAAQGEHFRAAPPYSSEGSTCEEISRRLRVAVNTVIAAADPDKGRGIQLLASRLAQMGFKQQRQLVDAALAMNKESENHAIALGGLLSGYCDLTSSLQKDVLTAALSISDALLKAKTLAQLGRILDRLDTLTKLTLHDTLWALPVDEPRYVLLAGLAPGVHHLTTQQRGRIVDAILNSPSTTLLADALVAVGPYVSAFTPAQKEQLVRSIARIKASSRLNAICAISSGLSSADSLLRGDLLREARRR